MMQINRRTYAALILLIFAVYFITSLSSLFVSNNVFFFGGWGAGVDNQRVFILSTGHIYAGQWNSRVSSNSKIMGWGLVGETADLGFEFLFTILQLILGTSFSQTFLLYYIPFIIPFTFPFLALGIYRRLAGASFNQFYSLLIFAYSCLGSTSFLLAATGGVAGIAYIVYAILFVSFSIGFGKSSQSNNLIILALTASAIPMVYHTFASYLIFLMTIMIVLELVVLRAGSFRKPVTNIFWMLLGIVLILFVSAFTIFTAPIGIFSFINNIASLRESSSNFFSYPGVPAADISSRVSSFINIISETVAGAFVLFASWFGLTAMIRKSKDNSLRALFYIIGSILVLSAALIVSVGIFTGVGRTYQAVLPLIPMIVAILFARSSRNILRILVVIALIGVVITPMYYIFFQPQFGATIATYGEISYVGLNSTPRSAIFTDFVSAESLTYFGRLNVFGISQFYSPSQFSIVANAVYGEGSSYHITSVISNITGEVSNIVMFTPADLHSVAMEDTSYNTNASYIKSYIGSFDLVYSSAAAYVFITIP